jgi:Ion transport protein
MNSAKKSRIASDSDLLIPEMAIIFTHTYSLSMFSRSHCISDDAPNFADPFFVIETTCSIWFTIELILRLIACPDKLRFVKDCKNVIDAIAVVPYYITLVNVLTTMSCSGAKSSASLSFLRVVRLVRVFKLTKHSVGLQVRLSGIFIFSSPLILLRVVLYCVLGGVVCNYYGGSEPASPALSVDGEMDEKLIL